MIYLISIRYFLTKEENIFLKNICDNIKAASFETMEEIQSQIFDEIWSYAVIKMLQIQFTYCMMYWLTKNVKFVCCMCYVYPTT